ncbi:MAG: peptide chain release factor N(5)-glutamine methyltransferase [Chloroflexi bacterium]|nr:peptide chain release factor N(5)-glutamine methyltransferase [Chloroflexota bacterium]
MIAQDALLDAVRALGATINDRDARLQAELLLAHALGVSRALALARLNDLLAPEIAAQYAANVARRAQNEPLAYILGHQEFYKLDFSVDRRVLIPRHETETLIELALARAPRESPTIVDVGTGSGAIALTLAHHLPDARVIALDVSPDALAVARMNAARLHLESRVEFRESDLLEHFHDSFDLLVANLPYIPRARFDQLPREVRAFEPRRALDGGDDGLDVLRRLLAQIEARAKRGATALFEISEEQGDTARQLAQQILPHCAAIIHRDLEGMDRVLEINLNLMRHPERSEGSRATNRRFLTLFGMT